MIDPDRYNRIRTYRGWSIRRTFPSGYWQGSTADRLSVLADTLAGCKEMIRHLETDDDCRCTLHQRDRGEE